MKRSARSLYSPGEAAERLGISVAEVQALISSGELPALTFMDDPRHYVHVEGVERMAARRAGAARARASFWRRLLSGFPTPSRP